jgi:hypothetical protein
MKKPLLIAMLAGLLVAAPGLAEDKHRKASHAKKKVETGASCKAPAVGTCAACNITCRTGEAAHCAPGTLSGDVCHIQPSCKCSR